jgi:hypothetical protein
MRRGLRTTMLCFALLAPLVLPGSAAAAIGVESVWFGASTSQAGAHPDVGIDVSFADAGEPETVKELLVELPPGLFVYPGTLPRCGLQLDAEGCPVNSQVGLAHVHANVGGDVDLGRAAVYLLMPEPDELARLGFELPGFAETVEVPVRASARNGYALSLTFENLPEAVPIAELEFTLWGVPPAPSHDEERGPFDPPPPGGIRPSSLPETPFIRNPTVCGATTATLSADSYEDPGAVSTAMASGPTITGCDKPPFNPVVALALSSEEAASPAGIGMEFQLPQSLAPDDIASSDAETIALYLLPGVTVDEAGVSQQATCSLAEANLTTTAPAGCPPASKIGTLGAALAGADGALEGSVYFGGLEAPGEYRLFLVATGAGLELKLPAWLASEGGETELVIPDIPQLPLEDLEIEVDPAVSLITTPPRCGTFEAETEAISWSEPDLAWILTTPFTIASGPSGGPCPEPQVGQTPPPPAAPAASLATPKPTVKLLKHPPHRGHDRTPSFRFTSSVPGSTFQCRIDRRPWRTCHSPLMLRNLTLGNHTFRVKAISPTGDASRPLGFRFVIAP